MTLLIFISDLAAVGGISRNSPFFLETRILETIVCFDRAKSSYKAGKKYVVPRDQTTVTKKYPNIVERT